MPLRSTVDGTISVDLTTIDKDILEDVTFIKMDI